MTAHERMASCMILAAIGIAASSAGASSRPASAPADQIALHRDQQSAFRAAAERVSASVITIETIGGTQPTAGEQARRGTRGAPPGGQRRPAVGFIVADGPATGVIWSSDGLILTSAFNFVRDPSVITVVLADGRRFVAELLAKDEIRQLAMIRIAAAGLPTIRWIDSPGDVRVGQWALALGRGFGGPSCSLSAGIISGMNRQAGLAVQTDAKLSPANFGGPLIDVQGRAIGLCVPMGMGTGEMAGVELYDSGIGFAVPGWLLRRAAEDLAVGHNIRRGMLGIAIQPTKTGGVGVAGVADPSPAQRAGIQAGDEIIAIEGIAISDHQSMQRTLRSRRAGERITVRVRRQAGEQDIKLVLAVPEDLGKMPQSATQPETSPFETPASQP